MAVIWASASSGPMGSVPILYQHRVVPLPQGIGTWTYTARQTFLATDTLPWSFAAQLDWLEAHGYTTILPRDLAEHWDRGVPLPARCVILTFDDGYPEWVSTVLPLLDAEDDPVAICSCHSFLFRPLCSMEVLPVEGVHATGPQTTNRGN